MTATFDNTHTESERLMAAAPTTSTCDVPLFPFVVIILGALFSGFGIGLVIDDAKFHRQAVEHGAAHYDATTGEWSWNKP